MDVWLSSREAAAWTLRRLTSDMLDRDPKEQGIVTDFEGRPIATVVNVHAFKGQHYAAFPKKLVEDPIEASTPPCACLECAAPYFRIVETDLAPLVEDYTGQARKDYAGHMAQNPSDTKRRILESMSRTRKKDRWVPTCSCTVTGTLPAAVLDPMMGTGTVGVVAVKKKRYFMGNDLNPDYVAEATERILREALGIRTIRVGNIEIKDDLLW
jgi:hypothetical protein